MSKLKYKLWKRIKGRNKHCPLCGKPMLFGDCNIDHIIPKADGGSGRQDNLQLTHKACNTRKGCNITPQDDLLLRRRAEKQMLRAWKIKKKPIL